MAQKAKAPATLAQKIDRLGVLEARIAPWQPEIKEAADLRKQIGQSFSGAAESSGELKGAHYFSVIGPRKNQTKIRNMRAVLTAVGQKLFLAHASYTLASLKQDAPDQYEALIFEERTGSRDVKTFALPAKAA